jgi:DNA-binding transcriptional regulator LsrR (DeoR family)
MSKADGSRNKGAGRLGEAIGLAPETLYLAANLYYDEQATQAEIATRLGTSRGTVSRLLAEARRQGIVRIAVHEPATEAMEATARQVAEALGLERVYLSAPVPPAAGRRETEDLLGTLLAPAVGRALSVARLSAGDVVLVSSGRTLFEVAQCELPASPGVVLAPTVGGIDQPEEWFQTNEIVHLLAERIGGHAAYLFAPALPGAELHASLLTDPTIQRVLSLWQQARVLLMGIGAAPASRRDLPDFTPDNQDFLSRAVGDVCSRFLDLDGSEVEYPGSERLIALSLAQASQVPTRIGVAAGPQKVTPILAAARGGHINQLVTDASTAEHVLRQLARGALPGTSQVVR